MIFCEIAGQVFSVFYTMLYESVISCVLFLQPGQAVRGVLEQEGTWSPKLEQEFLCCFLSLRCRLQYPIHLNQVLTFCVLYTSQFTGKLDPHL